MPPLTPGIRLQSARNALLQTVAQSFRRRRSELRSEPAGRPLTPIRAGRSRRRWVDPSDPAEGPALAAGYSSLVEMLAAAGGSGSDGDGLAGGVLPLEGFVAAVRAQVGCH